MTKSRKFRFGIPLVLGISYPYAAHPDEHSLITTLGQEVPVFEYPEDFHAYKHPFKVTGAIEMHSPGPLYFFRIGETNFDIRLSNVLLEDTFDPEILPDEVTCFLSSENENVSRETRITHMTKCLFVDMDGVKRDLSTYLVRKGQAVVR